MSHKQVTLSAASGSARMSSNCTLENEVLNTVISLIKTTINNFVGL